MIFVINQVFIYNRLNWHNKHITERTLFGSEIPFDGSNFGELVVNKRVWLR